MVQTTCCEFAAGLRIVGSAIYALLEMLAEIDTVETLVSLHRDKGEIE